MDIIHTKDYLKYNQVMNIMVVLSTKLSYLSI